MTTEQKGTQIHDKNEIICLICQSPIGEDEAKSLCSSCNNAYHSDCWTENKGCAVYGCAMVPPTEPLKELEIPVSYWGKEKKDCPSCGKEILAAALRCAHCGTIFTSARPQTQDEFHSGQTSKEQKSKLQRLVTILFILNIVTFTAPLGAIFGFFWYRINSEKLKSLPHIYPTLTKIGLAVGMAQTVLIIIFGVFYNISYA